MADQQTPNEQMENNSKLSQDQTPSPTEQRKELKENIGTLLKKSNLTIDELFQEEFRVELMKEFRLRNKTLISFLSKPDTILQLVTIIAKGERSQQDQFCAGELLTADITTIIGNLFYFIFSIFLF